MASWRNEVEDGMGWGGLVPAAAERRAEKTEAARRKELDQLRAENARLREAIAQAAELIEPWRTHCDYRAEEYLRKAYKLMNAALEGHHE